MSVGEHVLKYLIETGRTQMWLSKKTGISPVKLNLSLHGKRKLTFDEYANICGALEVTADKFIIPKTADTHSA